jgi:HlyD family secretion protein
MVNLVPRRSGRGARPGALVRQAQNAIERRVQSSHEEVVLQQSRFLARTLTWALIGCTGFGLTWLSLAQTEEVVVASGKLEPIGDVKTIQVPVGGVLDEMLVKDGERVAKGQVLLRLDNEATKDRELSLLKTIAAKQQQLQLKEVELQSYLTFNETEQEVLRQNLVLEREIMGRLETLKRVGASAELQYLQQRSRVRDVEGELSKISVDRGRQVAILEQSVQQLRGELADVQSKLTELRVNIRYQDIRSPVDGVVFDLKPTGPGFVAQGSEPVMKIVPYSSLKAKVEIDSGKIGFVRVGKLVDISIDSFPSTDFGVLHGTVKRIGSDALPPDQLNQVYRYPAEIQLDSQSLQLKGGATLPLQVGMSLTANIKLRKVSYLQLLLGEFKNKTDSLKRI